MELKQYQRQALDELTAYAKEVRKIQASDFDSAAEFAFQKLVTRRDATRTYQRHAEIGAIPYVCVKIPTGGGKTLVGAHAVGAIYETLLRERNDHGLVLWLSPLEEITSQSLAKLRDPDDPVRAALNLRFNGRVSVLDIEEAKRMRVTDVRDNVCIIVATMASFRRQDTSGLKVYQQNGSLMDHFTGRDLSGVPELELQEGEPIYSLANVIRMHAPLIVLDEGHNAQTDLSMQKLIGEMCPSFILEFTATPRAKSNVLVSIQATALKDEKMIKMPVFLFPSAQWQTTIREARAKRDELEKIAVKEKRTYIRPILLLQAEQEKESPSKVHVAQIVEFLTGDLRIPRTQIAIRTGKQDELPGGQGLFEKDCPIKYIVTVNALREGWDCSFAYVLASVSHLGTRVAVEQTIGRIMRLPYAKEYKNEALNSAYVYATASSFTRASAAVIEGLKENGYEGLELIPAGAPGVSLPEREFGRAVRGRFSVPLFSVGGGKTARPLEYARDLIGVGFSLAKTDAKVEPPTAGAPEGEKFDITKGGEITHERVARLPFLDDHADVTEAELVLWFSRKVRRDFVKPKEMSAFVARAVKLAARASSVALLSKERYAFLERLEIRVDESIDEWAKKHFDGLVKKGLGVAALSVLSERISYAAVSREPIAKHLYKGIGSMNGEETEFARKLATLPNIEWWFRNPEFSDFYLQGSRPHHFYPDFIVRTKKGAIFMLEYKGEHLIGADDTDYKEELGKLWEKLGGGKVRFALFGKTDIEKVLGEIAKY